MKTGGLKAPLIPCSDVYGNTTMSSKHIQHLTQNDMKYGNAISYCFVLDVEYV